MLRDEFVVQNHQGIEAGQIPTNVTDAAFEMHLKKALTGRLDFDIRDFH